MDGASLNLVRPCQTTRQNHPDQIPPRQIVVPPFCLPTKNGFVFIRVPSRVGSPIGAGHVVWVTQIIFYGMPWLQWNGRQAVLFDLNERRFLHL